MQPLGPIMSKPANPFENSPFRIEQRPADPALMLASPGRRPCARDYEKDNAESPATDSRNTSVSAAKPSHEATVVVAKGLEASDDPPPWNCPVPDDGIPVDGDPV